MNTGEVEHSYTFDQANHVYREDIVLSHEACYRLTIRDAAGEGMGNGFFQVKDSNNTVIFKGGNSGGKFTYELATELHCDGYVAVEENGPSTDTRTFRVYPNPTTDIVNLNFGKGQWTVLVYDITGRKVMEQQCEARTTIDFSQQQKGLYFLRAQNGTEEVNTKILVH